MDRRGYEEFGYELFLPPITVFDSDPEPVFIGIWTEHGVPIKRVIHKAPIGFDLRRYEHERI